MDDGPLAAGHDGDLAPLPEGAAPVRVVQLVGGLAAPAAQDLLGVQDSAPELKELKIKTMEENFNNVKFTSTIALENARFQPDLDLSSGPCLVIFPRSAISLKLACWSSISFVQGGRYSAFLLFFLLISIFSS